ncbi:MAG: anion permease [Gemmobacter sp.]|jgi:anion transporter|nr:anion permease [Gemmobacter sp.]
MKYGNLIGTAIITLIAVVIGLTNPWAPALSALAHTVLMLLLITIGLWVFRPFGLPFSMASFFLMASLLIVGLPLGQVFAGFTSAAVWTLIPALFFGYVILKSGLGKRIALLLLKQFNPSFTSLMVTFALIGIVLSVLTPAIVVRIAIMLPIALSCLEACKVKGDSREGALILLTALMTALIPGTGWLSGSLFGPIIQGMYESVPHLRGVVTFNSWAQVTLLPMAVVTAIMLIGGYLLFKPQTVLKMSRETFVVDYDKLGPMASQEKWSAIILILSFALFLTGGFGWHSIPDAAIVLSATFLLAAGGVINQTDVSIGVNWDNVIFIGTAMSLGTIFASVGLSDWISSLMIPLLRPISGNPWLFVYSVTILLFLWRFFDVAVLIPTKAILIPTLPLIGESFNIDPLVWVPIFVMAGNSFFLSYTNIFVMVGQSTVGEKGWTQGQINKYGLLYGAACLISLIVAIPYWQSLGMFH